MNVMQKKAIYDEMCGILTDYENNSNGFEEDAENLYEMLVKIQNTWDELVSPADGYEEDSICWKKYKEGDKKYLSVIERMTLPSKKYEGYYIDFPEGDSRDQEEWYIRIPDLLKLPRCKKG